MGGVVLNGVGVRRCRGAHRRVPQVAAHQWQRQPLVQQIRPEGVAGVGETDHRRVRVPAQGFEPVVVPRGAAGLEPLLGLGGLSGPRTADGALFFPGEEGDE
jgi:hypothetical protein